jgi:predicted polyphosphate/ATP-dependent NAD kinase
MEILGLPHTLLGFDLIRDGALVASDVRESDLLTHADELFVVISPTGRQGSLLGRGNREGTMDGLLQGKVAVVTGPPEGMGCRNGTSGS